MMRPASSTFLSTGSRHYSKSLTSGNNFMATRCFEPSLRYTLFKVDPPIGFNP